MPEPVLDIRSLSVVYHQPPLELRALRDVTVTVSSGEILGVIGESGCGKSTLAASTLGLLPGNAEIQSGSLLLNGRDTGALDAEGWRQLRGRHVALIPQDPLQSLNPTLPVGRQIADAVLAHDSRRARRSRDLDAQIAETLGQVGIPDGEHQLRRYPHQFSGGMRQRILIATALLLRPALLVADEPTSALDVTTEAQIVELIRRLREQHGTSVLFVTHNVGLVAQLCDRVVVMYAGRVVESADIGSFFADPRHPYSAALLKAVPTYRRRVRPTAIPGRVPNLGLLPVGCAYANRCPLAAAVCRAVDPEPVRDGGSLVRCHARDPGSGWQEPSGRTATRDVA